MEGYQQRPYNVQTVQRPAPQQYPPGTGSQQYVEHQNGYNGSGGFQGQHNGRYGYGDMSYGRGGPPPPGRGGYQQDYYGPLQGRGGPRPVRGAHGGPPHLGTSDDAKHGPSGLMGPPPGRGGYGPPPGRGGHPGQLDRSATIDLSGECGLRRTIEGSSLFTPF